MNNKNRADIATRFKPKPDSLAPTPVSIRFSKEIDAIVRSLPNRNDWLREAVKEKLEREENSDIQ